MKMTAFSAANLARCEAIDGFNHPLGSWTLSDWITATTGELGEAANIAKKLNRVRDGIPGNTQTEEELRAALADELADTFIYLDLLAQSQGIVLSDAVRSKFDRTSEKIGYGGRISDQTATPVMQVRYDVLNQELQRERRDHTAAAMERDRLARENARLRVALGLRAAPVVAAPRSMDN